MPDYNKGHSENFNVSSFPARSERYHHLETEEEDTNDEDFNVELRQFSSCSHRFSKVSPLSQTPITPITAAQDVTAINELMMSPHLFLFSWEIKCEPRYFIWKLTPAPPALLLPL